MSFYRLVHAFACLGCLLPISATASASERPALTGYNQIRFGMPEGELRTKIRIGEPRDDKEGGVLWSGMSPVNFAGPPSFWPKILVQDGVVARISCLLYTSDAADE